MAYGQLNADLITGSGAGSVIINNGTSNVAGFTTGNNLQMLQNGGGIVFSNSSALTNSTLNDYETGTWTPYLYDDIGGQWAGKTTNSAYYTKTGRMVNLYGYVTWTSKAGASTVRILGLPFATVLTSGGGAVSDWSGAVPTAYALRIENTPDIIFYSSSGGSPLAGASFSTTGTMYINVTYPTTF